ncbi:MULTISPECIES: DUF58 domain-containing protein [Rufibacter]|uniref:Uncharacterized protein (DUF58 family) n=1 Tax=Rufibacter quisquiliarum TaxID=1549639 RepID=A0A839GPM1_9BACT|nr:MULTISPECIES: DUF58 domain-containing protein [Rufibacter]MBA9077475.1 uncharacterized protein (DUF58 family) [Rufibacter quisquiliarum]
MKDLVRKLRKYEIQIRKAIDSQMQGDFKSVFKSSGLEFDDVRAYQYGDDVRSIDWNVTAKGHGTFVKTYREEKEQNVFLLLDVSGSQALGIPGGQKIDIGKEISGILALAALKQGSQLGMICFSDVKERYIKPGKGNEHAYSLIKALAELQPQSTKTDIGAGIRLALNVVKRKSIIILISDFIDNNYDRELTMLAKKHDLVVLQLMDKRETSFPGLGIVPLLDKETGKTIWINTSSKAFREKYLVPYAQNQEKLARLCRQYQADFLPIYVDQEYTLQLVQLFRARNKIMKRSA